LRVLLSTLAGLLPAPALLAALAGLLILLVRLLLVGSVLTHEKGE
jgi:hypothetical protein